MNRLLVTGLALGTEADVCQVCNFDYSWLLRYPSILIWADKIMVTEAIWDSIIAEIWPQPRELAKCFKIIFETAKSEGIIEIVDPSPVVKNEIKEMIYEQIDKDLELFKLHFPDKVSTQKMGDKDSSPVETILDGVGYCPAYIWSIYAGLILARTLKANCLFDYEVMHYCRYKFGITNLPTEGDIAKLESFRKIFDSKIPNEPLIPGYAIEARDKCSSCVYEVKCKDTFLLTLETDLKKYLKWREYDEITELKTMIERVIKKQYEINELINPNDVISNFYDKEKKLRKKIHSVFPKVKRWANITTMVSIPIGVIGIASGGSLITFAAASTVGLSQLTKELIQLLENKYRWVTFLPSSVKDKTTGKSH